VLKRVRWIGAGMALGVGTSWWAQRKVKLVMARYSPAGVGGMAVTKAKDWPGQVRAAVREGRVAMREREAELRAGTSGRESQAPTRP
jgi:hypothetical protein